MKYFIAVTANLKVNYWLRLLFGAFFALITMASAAYADHAETYLDINCMKDLNFFSVINLKIGDADKTQEVSTQSHSFVLYSSLANKPYKCKLRDHTVTIEVTYIPDQPNPPYTANHGTYSITWDTKKIGNYPIGSFATEDTYLDIYSVDHYPSPQKLTIGKMCNLSTGTCDKLNIADLK